MSSNLFSENKKIRNIVPVQTVKNTWLWENYEKVYTVLTYMNLIYCQLTNYNGTSWDICPGHILGLRKYLSKRSSQLRYVTKKKKKKIVHYFVWFVFSKSLFLMFIFYVHHTAETRLFKFDISYDRPSCWLCTLHFGESAAKGETWCVADFNSQLPLKFLFQELVWGANILFIWLYSHTCTERLLPIH